MSVLHAQGEFLEAVVAFGLILSEFIFSVAENGIPNHE